MTSGTRPRHRRNPARHDSGRPHSTALLLVALFTGACGAFAWTTGVQPVSPSSTPTPVAFAAPVTGQPQPRATPARIDISEIGVSADIESLTLNGDGTLATPRNWNSAGWYAGGVTPGAPGPAIVVGHRDSAADGPAVFYRLGELTVGDEVTITENDGSTERFVVESLKQVAKADFPTAEVYGPSEHRLLRLITCTGDFDYAARSYVDNLVVTARAV